MKEDTDRYARIHEILSGARELFDAELDAYLDENCGDDASLRADVLQLLDAARRDRSRDAFGESQLGHARSALEGVLDGASADWLPETIGEYRVVRQIGRGGMGVVYEAEQASPQRRVAIKLLHPMQVTEERLRRFDREVALLGQLQHPGIARIYEAGTYDDGRGAQPFFAMELVDGVDIRTYCDRNQLDRDARIELLARVADAVQHAHDHDVIHRDLKPDNILVDADGNPRILDFGIAHSNPESTALSSLLTEEGQIVGTLAYMAPEQLEDPTGLGLTPRVDVFALGVLGFELLLGRLPREIDDLPIAQAVSVLARSEPARAGTLDTSLRGDVDTILGKALETDAERRYDCAAAFAGDLRRFLAHEPIRARAPSRVYLMRKFARRHKVVFGGVATTLLVAITGAVIATNYALDALRANSELQSTNKDLAAAKDRADESAIAARESARREKQRADEVFRLSGLQELADLKGRAASVWPAHPDELDAIRSWVEDASELVAQLPLHEATRERLRGLALPRTEDERRADRESHPRWKEFQQLTAEVASLRRAESVRSGAVEFEEVPFPDGHSDRMRDLVIGASQRISADRRKFGDEAVGLALARRALERGDDQEKGLAGMLLAQALFVNGLDDAAIEAANAALENATKGEMRMVKPRHARVLAGIEAARNGEPLATKAAELEALDALVDERRKYCFPEGLGSERWWESQLTLLIDGIRSFTDERTGLLSAGVSAETGWGIRRRLDEAEALEHAFAPGGKFARRWSESLDSIRAAYPGLALRPQMGLVPIGADPDSGLWEFWHVQSGDEPMRDANFKLQPKADDGLVFVLLPSATYWMGAQKDEGRRNHDPDALDNESPVHEVTLSAFFLSKYEMTQGQWQRMTGTNPSLYFVGHNRFTAVNTRNSVESVSWDRCVEVLGWLGLALPTEAQWEFACRAGTTTPFHCASADDLEHHANLGEQAYAGTFRERHTPPAWNDGFDIHGTVGSLRPNAFGFHDMHGNVWEWCLDGYDSSIEYPSTAVRDPLTEPAGVDERVRRGGAYNGDLGFVRSSLRHHNNPTFAGANVGLRPARAVE